MRWTALPYGVVFLANLFQSIVRYSSADVGVGLLDSSGVGTPLLHELDNMDPSGSGDPWYPLECIYCKVVWWLLYAVHRRCSKSVIFVLSAVRVRCEWRRGMFAYVGRFGDRSALGQR